MHLINKIWQMLRPSQKPDPDQIHLEQDNGMLTIPRDNHSISRKQISPNALKVLYRLKDAGYSAYLVGGAVRDLLLGKHPKDFDIATDAHPEEVNALFRNSVLIGRRFRLVHVRFGREIIEVATFRANHTQGMVSSKAQQNEEGMLTRDNVYGSIEEDAVRRDFTVNGLYYNIDGFIVHDYAQGFADLNERVIRMIGDPVSRYREDPVRMLRALRFSVKLDFTIEKKTSDSIFECGQLLEAIPPARMFDEVLKLFLSGYGEAVYHALQKYNLFEQLFPDTQALIVSDSAEHALVENFILCALRNSDVRITEGKSVTPAFLLAALLWHPLQEKLKNIQDLQDLPPIPVLHQAAHETIIEQCQYVSIPRRFGTTIKAIWELQLRLPYRKGRRALQVLDNPKFRAGYDFLLIREKSGEKLEDLGAWWTRFQFAKEEQKLSMIQVLDSAPKSKSARTKQKANAAQR